MVPARLTSPLVCHWPQATSPPRHHESMLACEVRATAYPAGPRPGRSVTGRRVGGAPLEQFWGWMPRMKVHATRPTTPDGPALASGSVDSFGSTRRRRKRNPATGEESQVRSASGDLRGAASGEARATSQAFTALCETKLSHALQATGQFGASPLSRPEGLERPSRPSHRDRRRASQRRIQSCVRGVRGWTRLHLHQSAA